MKKTTPRMLSKKSTTKAKPSLAKPAPKTIRPSAKPKKTRHRSATGSAAHTIIAGRHAPKNKRYKTGYWRPVRQNWMSDEVWEAYKAINRFRNKVMSKGLKKASLGKEIYGKEGPGHAGYGTGRLQKWVDKVLRQQDGQDPHFVDLAKWFTGAVAAVDYHNGADFKTLMEEQRKDPDHFMRYVIERMQEFVPEARKLSRRGVEDIIKNKYYTAQYGPDGRAK